MEYKLLALDVDGTLFTSRGTITPHTKRKIHEAQQLGVIVTLATGRHYPIAKVIAKELRMDVPIITHDGAYIADPRNDEVYYVSRIPNHVVVGTLRLLLPLRVRVMIQHESESISNQKVGWKELVSHIGQLASLKYYLLEKYSYQHVPSDQMIQFVSRKGISPPKIFVMGDQKQLDVARERLSKRYYQEIRMTTSGYGLEIVPIGNSKGNALKILGEKLEIAQEEMIAIGDHYNDLEIIQFAGLGVAMGNAPAEIREQADYVTGTNDEEGIADVIDRFLLNK